MAAYDEIMLVMGGHYIDCIVRRSVKVESLLSYTDSFLSCGSNELEFHLSANTQLMTSSCDTYTHTCYSRWFSG